jgi:L-amino acid N-acyltransferase YncA
MIIRSATSDDVAAMQSLIFEHGPNEWNFIPEKEIREHLNKVRTDEVRAVLAEIDAKIIGFVTFHPSTYFNRYSDNKETAKGYIREAVVHRGHVGKGLGTKLLGEAVKQLHAWGFDEIYIDRHEENRASAGMMKKAGFKEIDTFLDSEHRAAGSRRTTVCRIRC